VRQKIYKDEKEQAAWQARDPLGLYRDRLLADGLVNEAELEGIDEQVLAAVEAAVKFGKQSPEPALKELMDDVYA
jgi:TPP-dependent pyruvate/acetoin dehydrogenase alpha subunit